MKSTFDNAGVGQFQYKFLLLPLSARATLIHSVRSNFPLFLLDNFEFSPSQQMEIQNMSAAFASEVSEGIANTWESGQSVIFQKDAKPGEGEHVKDRVYHNPNSPTQRQAGTAWLPVSIYIRYHLP
ncbi:MULTISPECIES: hypothetical protein [Sphingobacterium]|uniref:Uncharacterized protein n=1 Tax=Sphingobacterium athyrii TaxID=2152717 RepID=A0A363NV90_9SPHI|nr:MULTISPECIES: hypothetical protein [Sphingobacterium]PUV24571.1 hypothetical protein DCO56_14615 [Sphingobacterium athyrii]QIH33840.1 hypothetical protein G6053_13535 [Sphingobacterium sp. DR205]